MIMHHQLNFRRLLFWLTIFAIAMAFMESAVVVYLREIFYPDGFRFPLSPVTGSIAITEIFREAATIIMLLCLGYIAGKKFTDRFAWFLYAFALWDIFYYVFLKIILNWPDSFLSWDILFLIPLVWVGPVICPIILSLTMILLAQVILYFTNKSIGIKIKTVEWLLLVMGSIVVIVSFTIDYAHYVLSHFNFTELWAIVRSDKLYLLSLQYLPDQFNWWIFILGEMIILAGIAVYFKRNYKRTLQVDTNL